MLTKILRGGGPEYQIECQKERLGERVEQHRENHHQDYSSIQQPVPGRRGPGIQEDTEKDGREDELRCYHIEHVCPDLITLFTACQPYATDRTAVAYLEPMGEERPAAAVGAAQQGRPPKEDNRALPGGLHARV